MRAFLVTFQRFTPESLEHGEAEESGVLYESASLREAVEELSYAAGGIHASEHPAVCPAWIMGAYTHDDPQTGEFGNLSLHFPAHITPASRRRVLRLLQR